MSKKQFQFLDIAFLTAIAIVLDFITLFLFRNSNKIYSVSLSTILLIVIIFRWGWRAVIFPTILVGLAACAMLAGGDLEAAAVYGVGNLFILLPWFSYKNKLFKVKEYKGSLALFTGAVFLSLAMGRTLVSFIFNFDISLSGQIFVGHFFSTGLDLAVAIIALMLARGQGELLQDMNQYLELRRNGAEV